MFSILLGKDEDYEDKFKRDARIKTTSSAMENSMMSAQMQIYDKKSYSHNVLSFSKNTVSNNLVDDKSSNAVDTFRNGVLMSPLT